MKRKMMSILLVAGMVLSLAACGDKEGSEGKGTSESIATSTGNEGSEDNESVESSGSGELTAIKLLSKRKVMDSMQTEQDVSTFDSNDGNNMYNAYKERLAQIGLTLEVEAIENEQYETIISTRLASGTDLPDFLYMGNYSSSDIVKYGEDGLIVDILSLVNQYDEDGSIRAFWDKYFPDYIPCASTPDGKLYTIPWLVYKNFVDHDGEYTGNTLGVLIRGDWLDKINVEYKPIITTEEFKDIMVAFREQDVNGNGVADEVIALDPTKLGWNQGISMAFGFNKFVSYNADQEKLSCLWYEKDAATAYISWVQELIDAELFDTSIIGSSDVATTLLSGNRAGAVADMLTESWLEPQVPDENAEYLPVIISSSFGTAIGVNDRHNSYTGGFAIPASCDHLEDVVKFMDYYFTDEDTIFRFYGPEGNYTVDEDGYIAQAAEGEWTIDTSPSIGNIEDADGLFRCKITPYKRADYVEYTQSERKNSFLGQVFDRSIDFELLEDNIPFAAMTEEEATRMSEIENELTTYMEEALAKLILKQYSLDDFDTYVEEMKGLGLEDYVNIQQGRINRYLGK